MKQAIIGLKKRETYDELINDLDHDLIKNYPDRRASELENSSYMSQLRGSFEEMLMQNDNLMKEKQKEMLLHEQAGQANVGRHEISINEARWRPHVAPEPEELFHTPDRPAPAPAPAPEVEPLRVPVGQPVAYMPNRPEIQISATRSRGSRKARNRNHPVIQGEDPAQPEHYNIGSPLNSPRVKMKGEAKKTNLAHDVDPEVERAHLIAVDDEEMHQQIQEEFKTRSTVMTRLMLEASQLHSVDDYLTARREKRREEGANPNPAKPKARHTKPKRKADEEPETKQEPRGPPGRPRNTPASAPTDMPPQTKASPPKSQSIARA